MIKVNLPNKEYGVVVKIYNNNIPIIQGNNISYEYEKGPILYFPPKKTFDVKGQIVVSYMDRHAMYDLGLLELPKLKNLSMEILCCRHKPEEYSMCKLSTIILDIHGDDVVRGPLEFNSPIEPKWYPLKIIK